MGCDRARHRAMQAASQVCSQGPQERCSGVFSSRRDRVGQRGAPQSPVESGAHRGGGPSLQGLQQEGLEPAQSPERTCMWAGGSGVLGRGWFGGSTDSPRAMLSSPLWERMSHLETSQLPAWVAVGGRWGCPHPSHFPGVSQTPAWTSGWLDPSCPPHSGVQSGPRFSPPRGRRLVGYPRPQPRGPHDSPSLTPELQGGPARDDLLRAPRKGPPGLSSHGVTLAEPAGRGGAAPPRHPETEGPGPQRGGGLG